MGSNEKDTLLTLKEREDPLTRSEVATYLNLSISTVRRLEGKDLHPTIGDRGIRYFDAAQVLEVAARLARDTGKPAPSAGDGQNERPSPGELAARVFERFEQRQSLSEIVTALRVTPKRVRALYHEWRTGLERGEQLRERPAPRLIRRTYHRADLLAEFLSQLPEGQSTRISFAVRGKGSQPDPDCPPYDVFDELPGFVTDAPVDWSSIRGRYPPGYYRVTAYSLADRRLLWEIYVEIPETIRTDHIEIFR